MQPTVTLYQFNSYCDNKKIDILESAGVYLELNRKNGPHKIGLFALHGFYVEVHYNRRSDQIDQLNAFSSLKRLDIYLAAVNIESAVLASK